MSIQALAWVLENSQARLGDRCVLFSIANHCDRLGENAWPSLATIAHEARLSERQARRAIRNLELMRELRVKMNAGPHATNLYAIPGVCQGLVRIDSELPDHHGDKLSGGTNRAEKMSKMSPEPSFKPSVRERLPRSKHSSHSDRPTEAQPDGRRKRSKTSQEEQAAEGLLTQALGKVDPYLARGILEDCHEENPEASREVFLVKLSIVLTEGHWKSKRNPAGWIRTTMRELVRRDRLEVWEQSAARRLEAVRNRHGDRRGGS